tara:strand:- start:130 stop:597 length:468 start_codon:yes stop_codon:yes gene_type:complete
MLDIKHNYLSAEQYKNVENYCYSASYVYGERDNPYQMPTGLVHNLELNNKLVDYFPRVVNTFPLFRAYINFFSSGDKPNFHVDGESGYTSLFYINSEAYNSNEGGCTEIFDGKDTMTSVMPFRNTLLTFSANKLHRATPFRTQPRFTVALKYQYV